jgi:hypothetical protein
MPQGLITVSTTTYVPARLLFRTKLKTKEKASMLNVTNHKYVCVQRRERDQMHVFKLLIPDATNDRCPSKYSFASFSDKISVTLRATRMAFCSQEQNHCVQDKLANSNTADELRGS